MKVNFLKKTLFLIDNKTYLYENKRNWILILAFFMPRQYLLKPDYTHVRAKHEFQKKYPPQ